MQLPILFTVLLLGVSIQQHTWTIAFSPQSTQARLFSIQNSFTSLQVLRSPPQQQQQQRNNATTTSTGTGTGTPTPKYPTLRGTTVDARKIIKSGVARQYLTAIRLAHILF